MNLQVSVLNPERMLDSMQQENAELAVGAFAHVEGLEVLLLDTRQ